MFEYIDMGILIIIISILLSLLLMKILFRFVSMPKFLKVLIIIIAIVFNSYLIYDYINENERGIINKSNNYYVSGVVLKSTPSINKLQINITSKNIKLPNDQSTILVEVKKSTAIRENKSGTYSVISLNDIKQGDVVKVYCNTAKLGKEENQIEAKKIIKINNKNK